MTQQMNSTLKQHNTVTTFHTILRVDLLKWHLLGVCLTPTHTHVESCRVEVISRVLRVTNDISKLIVKLTCQKGTTDDYTLSLSKETEDRAIEGI